MWYIKLPAYTSDDKGHPTECYTVPALKYLLFSETCHTSLKPIPYYYVLIEFFSKSNFYLSLSVSEPLHPSVNIVYFAIISTPGWKLSFISPFFDIPISPVLTPTTLDSESSNKISFPENPDNIWTPNSSAYCANHSQSYPKLII